MSWLGDNRYLVYYCDETKHFIIADPFRHRRRCRWVDSISVPIPEAEDKWRIIVYKRVTLMIPTTDEVIHPLSGDLVSYIVQELIAQGMLPDGREEP